ncbi:hypothetical protein [Natrinema halophilum]|uniref:Uncharacterized protein n=1 Tax=Natrinema halophilum TaxID=1699371 RepID=A0A7D5K4E2_9EURY|nr:hypothetical protein [Natrinema halophilum]QLG47483.1 hypothetical protein HYG82_00785 [Natrinema halophilum]
MRPLVLAVLCCSVVGLAGVAVVAGAPPPSQVCGVCGPGIGDDAALEGATGHGTLDVYVDETGDSRWSARIPVTPGAAERYRENATALEAAVDGAWGRYHAAAGDVRAVESSLDRNVVVVNYTVNGLARRGVGDTWVVDYFATGTSRTHYERVAERVTIHTPDGTVVTNRIPGAEVDDNTATWTGENERSGGDDFGEQLYLTYGTGGVFDTANGYATIGLAVGPGVLVRAVSIGIVPGVMIGLVGAFVGRGSIGDRTSFARTVVDETAARLGLQDAPLGSRSLEESIVAVGAIGAIVLLLFGAVRTGSALSPGAVVLSSLGFGYALIGVTVSRIGDRLEMRGLVGLVVIATIAAAGYTRLLAGPVVYPLPLVFGFATGLCLPIGFAFERGRTPIGLLGVIALVPSAGIALVYPMTTAHVWNVAIGVLLFLPWIAVVALFGTPLALLGRQLGTSRK